MNLPQKLTAADYEAANKAITPYSDIIAQARLLNSFQKKFDLVLTRAKNVDTLALSIGSKIMSIALVPQETRRRPEYPRVKAILDVEKYYFTYKHMRLF